MTTERTRLPQLDGDLFLTDGGIETTLIFNDGLDLPFFAAFHLLKDDHGRNALGQYYRRHASIALAHGLGFILESATWRASADWGQRLGYSADALDLANRAAIDLLNDLRQELETSRSPMVISGCVGPRGDGYRADALMTVPDAQTYHAAQIHALAAAGADLVSAITMTNSAEAAGIALAACEQGLPAVVSFTVETNGRLPTGESLGDAIETVDWLAAGAVAYFMINCAHPVHFAAQLTEGEPWVERIRGVRANASTCSHAELDQATTLDAGDPVDFGRRYRQLRSRFPHINVLGGCCGTDHRHIAEICEACLATA